MTGWLVVVVSSLREYCQFQIIIFSPHCIPVVFVFQLETLPNLKHILRQILLFTGAEFTAELDWLCINSFL